MRIADIFFFYHPRECAGTIHFQTIIEHFDLDIRAPDSIIAVSHGIYDDFCTNKLAVFLIGDKDAIATKICPLLHLVFDKSDSLLDLLQDTPFEYLILDNIHFPADFSFCAVIANETDVSTGKKYLRAFPE